MSTVTTEQAAEAAQSARLTATEADALAEARLVLAAIEKRSHDAGVVQADVIRAMYLGKVAEAASVADDTLANLLICAHVYNDDAAADYALKRDRAENRPDDDAATS